MHHRIDRPEEGEREDDDECLGAGFDGLAGHGGGVLVARDASAKGENFSGFLGIWPLLAVFTPESGCYACEAGQG